MVDFYDPYDPAGTDVGGAVVGGVEAADLAAYELPLSWQGLEAIKAALMAAPWQETTMPKPTGQALNDWATRRALEIKYGSYFGEVGTPFPGQETIGWQPEMQGETFADYIAGGGMVPPSYGPNYPGTQPLNYVAPGVIPPTTPPVVPPVTPPVMPPVVPPVTPTLGETMTDEYGTWTLIDNNWVLTDPGTPPATTPPVTPPGVTPPVGEIGAVWPGGREGLLGNTTAPITGGAGMAIQNPWPAGSPEQMEEMYGRWPGYGTALGLFGKQYLSPYQKYQAGMQPGLETLYDVGGRMGTAGGFSQYAPGGMFSQWAPQYATDPRSMYGRAQSMMGSVFGMSPEQRAGADVGYGTAPQDLASLLTMGLRTQLGKGTAGWLAGKMPAEQQTWMAQDPQQQGPSFLDYLKAKYNLGQYFG